MASLSVEARALRRSNGVFKSGVDPENITTVLYSNFLLTPEERDRVRHTTLTSGQQLEELFTVLERRVATNAKDFHVILETLEKEPALKAVAGLMKGFYDEEKAKANGASGTSGTQPPAANHPTPSQPPREVDPPTLDDLVTNVKVVEWYPFALKLLDDEDTVNLIERDTALPRIQDKLREVYKNWLETSEDPTWNIIVTTLRGVKNNRLARAVEKKFC